MMKDLVTWKHAKRGYGKSKAITQPKPLSASCQTKRVHQRISVKLSLHKKHNKLIRNILVSVIWKSGMC